MRTRIGKSRNPDPSRIGKVIVLGRSLTLFFALTAITTLPAKQAPPLPHKELTQPMKLEDALSIIKNSQEQIDVEAAAISLCMIGTDSALDQLAMFLADPSFRKRLDPYDREGDVGQRLTWVLEKVGKLSALKAEQVLLKLAADDNFVDSDDCGQEIALIQGCGWIQKPSSKMLDFLNSQLDPAKPSHYRYVAMRSLLKIGSVESCSLLEKCILSKDYEMGNDKFFFRDSLLSVRTKPGVVNLCKKLLSSPSADAQIRNLTAQSLFDYGDWYGKYAHPIPQPPKWSETSLEVLKQLLEIADMALNLDITKETREGVLKAQKEIQGILADKLKSRG